MNLVRVDRGGVGGRVGVAARDQLRVVVDIDEAVQPEPIGMVGIVEQQDLARPQLEWVSRLGDGDVTDTNAGLHRSGDDGRRLPADHRGQSPPHREADDREHRGASHRGRQQPDPPDLDSPAGLACRGPLTGRDVGRTLAG